MSTTVLFQIPRNTLVWLLIAQAMIIAPHLLHLPVWVVVAWLAVVLWRVQIYRGVFNFPNRWIKMLVLGLAIGGLVIRYGQFLGLEPMVGLLVAAFILKLLEMHRRRDALVLIYLGYFVAAIAFLFSQSILMGLYIAVVAVVLTTTLVSLHQSGEQKRRFRGFSLSWRMFFECLPVMLVLFLVIPRLGTFWTVPQQRHAASTGVSDSMSPGDFTNLAQNNSPAFRVTFDGERPPQEDLYWRGLVFAVFDGRTWKQSFFSDKINWDKPMRPDNYDNFQPQPRGDSVAYSIIMEPTQQSWLYSLGLPSSSTANVGLTRDFYLSRRLPVRKRTAYDVVSHLQFQVNPGARTALEVDPYAVLPDGSNPQTQTIAQQWFDDANNNVEQYIQRVLNYFNREFIYTLSPPLLGEHTADEFLWQTKAGFCEHFASSFVILMRAAGIPARVAVGYQGGEWNNLENYLMVRQSDAHAWAEVWFAGRGWVRFDPTAAVAPERIRAGLNNALSAEDMELLNNPFSLSSYSGVALLNFLRLKLDAYEYNWHRWVVSYDQDRQRNVLRNLLGDTEVWRIAILLFAIAGAVIATVAFMLWYSGKDPSPSVGDRCYRQFLKRLAKHGIERQTGEAPRTLAERASKIKPEWSKWIWQVTKAYEGWAYAEKQNSLVALRTLAYQLPK